MKNTNSSNPSDIFEKSSGANSLSSVAIRYLPFWHVFLIAIVLSLAVSNIFIRYQTPFYEANATILLKEPARAADNGNLLAALGTDGGSSKKVENEVEVLKSHILLQDVVKSMSLYTNLYRKGTFHDMLIYQSPVKFIASDPNALQNSGNIAVSLKYLLSKGVVILDGKEYLLNTPLVTPYGKFTIVINNKKDETFFVQDKAQYYLQIRDIKTSVNMLLGALVVAPAAKESSLIELKFTDQVPFRAEDILNNLISTYNKAGIDYKNETTENTLKFIENRLLLVTKDLSNVEDTLQRYRTREGIISLTDEGRAFLGNVQQNDESLAQLQIQLDVLDQIEKYIKNKGSGNGTVPAIVGINAPLLSQLLDKLYAAELDLSQRSQISGENSPAIIALKQQIDALRHSLLENVTNLRQNLITTQNRLKSELNKNSYLIKSVPKKEQALLEINRQQSIKNSIYTYLLQKREETALSAASAVADSRIINYAESNDFPIKPIPTNIYLIGLFIGFFSGVIFVLIKEYFNQEVLFSAEIEKATNVPIIAEIINDEGVDPLVIKDGKRTVIAEQIRALRTSLNYIGIQGDNKTILVTSSISGEGKSFLGVNLAVSLSLTGKKVVLLEFDLRKPKVSKMLEIAQEPGISNYLAGLASLEAITKSMDKKDLPGLFILPAGNIPPNPTELMLNGRLDTLMADLNSIYDYIIIDSPPIGLVTDAKILNKYINACLYMVRHKYTPKNYLKLIDHLYFSKEMKNLNIVFNGIKSRGLFGNYGSTYGSSYGYGTTYGYGYTDEQKDNSGLKSGIKKIMKK